MTSKVIGAVSIVLSAFVLSNAQAARAANGIAGGGRERNATLGLGWYANNFVRISGNLVHVYAIDGGKYDDESLNALQMRFQLAY